MHLDKKEFILINKKIVVILKKLFVNAIKIINQIASRFQEIKKGKDGSLIIHRQARIMEL